MEWITSLALGLCVSAACGFRVFAPLLVLALAGRFGVFVPAEELAWIVSDPALAVFGSATVAEIAAYYVPLADHLLDALATPAALLAGVLATAAVLGELSPLLQWTVAAIGGGGVAGVVQSGTVLLRGASSATTGGAGNALVASVENGLSIGISLLALVLPVVTAVLLLLTLALAGRALHRTRQARADRRASP